ncbi:MAG: hypothetical protein HQK63_10010 [Desulfamplus sp.]|nr:hypothetical protein [Desulfamplus sp.]
MKQTKKVIYPICLMALFTLIITICSVNAAPVAPNTTTTNDTVLELSTDKEAYRTGDIIQLTIKIGGSSTVDIYMTATFPDGAFASYTATMMPDSANSIIPLIKGIPLSTINGTYTLPIPVVPLFPEGTSEIWFVFVKAGRNPMVLENWLADSMVYLTVDQNENIEPLFDLESKTLTAALGEIGTIKITFGDATNEDGTVSGEVTGSINITRLNGETLELQLTGQYSYFDKDLTIYLEGDENFSVELKLTFNDDGTLTGSYETGDGKSGDINFTIPK